MEVKLSIHAQERCRRRGISIKQLIDSVKTLPPVSNYVEWTLPGGVVAVVKDDGRTRIVVTVYRKKYKRKRVAH